MKNFYFVLAAIAVMMMSSCGMDMLVRIDNPTDQTITVTIDDKTYDVPAGALLKITGIKPGEHTMKVDGGEQVRFTMDSGNAILNPTLSTYVLSRQEYGVGLMSNRDFITFEKDGYEWTGPFQVFEATPYFDLTKIDIAPGQEFPESSTRDELYKLFRWNEFIEYYE